MSSMIWSGGYPSTGSTRQVRRPQCAVSPALPTDKLLFAGEHFEQTALGLAYYQQ
jgi:hypothetical protein